MKKITFLSIFIFLGAHGAAAAPSYDSTAAELSQAMKRFRSLDESAAPLDLVMRRDPMVALVDSRGNVLNPSGLQQGLFVQGVIWSRQDKSVLIDDTFYREGDVVGPYKILEIQRDGFWAATDNEPRVFIPLYTEDDAEKSKILASIKD